MRKYYYFYLLYFSSAIFRVYICNFFCICFDISIQVLVCQRQILQIFQNVIKILKCVIIFKGKLYLSINTLALSRRRTVIFSYLLPPQHPKSPTKSSIPALHQQNPSSQLTHQKTSIFALKSTKIRSPPKSQHNIITSLHSVGISNNKFP